MPSSSTRPTDDGTARHPLNVSYLVLGLVFLGMATMWAMHAAGVVDDDQLGLLLPLTLVVAGAVGLVAFTAKGVSRSRRTADPDPAGDDPGYDAGYDGWDPDGTPSDPDGTP